MANFSLDGTPTAPTSPEAPATPIPEAPSISGLPPAPNTPRFSLDGTLSGSDINGRKIGLAMDQPDLTPERAIRVLKMEKATRLPLPLIEENLEDVERQVEKKNFDPDRYARENPRVAAWLAAHPQHAALAKDDHNNLSMLEQIIGTMGRKEPNKDGLDITGPMAGLKQDLFTETFERPEGTIHALSKQERMFELRTQRQVVLDRMQAYESAASGKRMLPSERRMMVPTDVGRERLAELDAEMKRIGSIPTYGGQLSAADATGEVLRSPIKMVPFAGSAPSVEQLSQVYAAAKRVEAGRGTQDDQAYLSEFLTVAQTRAKTDQTWGAHVVNIVSMLPGFVGEFALTGGAYTAGKEGAQKLIGKMLGEGAEQWAKKTIAGRVATGAVGAAFQTPIAMPARITEGTLNNLIKQHSITQDDANQVKVVLGPDGENVGAAAGMAALDSYIEMVTERSGGILGEMFNKIPGATKLAAFKAAVVSRWFKSTPNPTVVNLLNTIRTKGGWHGVLAEMGEERVGEILRAATGVDDKYRLKELYEKGGVPELFKQLSAEFAAFLIPGMGAHAVRSMTGRIDPDQIVNAERAKQTEQVFTSLGEVATESKTRERLPEKFEELIGQMTKDGPVENLYVPVEFYQTHWSEQGLDPRAVAAEMGIAKQYDEAITTGGRMEIPTAVYARRIAATEHNTVFAKELSMAPDVMNAREAEEFLKTAGEQVEEKPDTAFEDSLSKVREDIRGQMIGLYPQDVVDKYIALEIDSKFATRAKRLGVDPMELYGRRPLTVSRQLPAVLKKLGKVTNLDALIDRVKTGEKTLNQGSPETAAAESLERHFAGLGIDIKTLSNEEVKRILSTGEKPAGEYTEEYGQPKDRLERPPGQDVYTTAGGVSPAQGWAESTVVRGADGRPARIFRGSRNRVGLDHFDPSAFGKASNKIAAAFGVWFTRSETEAQEYAEKVEGGQVWEYHLDLRNPKVFTIDTMPSPTSRQEAMAIARSLQEQGHDGIVYDMRAAGGDIHFITFTPEQVIFSETAGLEVSELTPEEIAALEAQGITFYQSEPAKPQLSVLHNLSSENLEFADQMGGLAVPSLAVVKEGMGLEHYGDITLIGRKELADPKQVEVYDADAYTSTFPRPEYRKVKSKTAQKLVDDFRPWADKFADGMTKSEVWDNAVNTPNPDKSIGQMLRSNAAKAWFLSEQGVEVAPVMSAIEPRYGWTHASAWINFVKTADHKADDLDWNDPARKAYHKAAGDAAIQAMRENAEKYRDAGFTQEEIDDIVSQGSEQFIGEDGALGYGFLVSAIDAARDKGKKSVNRAKTEKKLDKSFAGKEVEFKKWVENKILPMYDDPFLTLGRKKVEYNLENIVDYMTRGGVHAQEETMTFGEGKARAVAAARITSFQEMRNRAETQITDREEVDKIREKAKKAMEEWRNKVVDYYGDKSSREFGRVWEGLDASMRAIAKWAKGRGLAEALRSEGFKNVPDYVIDQGKEAGGLFMQAPVPYFEAKPERAVKLEEFAGAVISSDASDNVKAILKKHNIPFKTYPKRFDEAARTAVVNKFRQELARQGEDVLFQKGGDIKRGLIRLGKDRINIELLQNANLSTFLHELSHKWLDELIEDATSPNAPQQLKDDLDRALAYLKVDARTEHGADAIRKAVTEEHHETWARSGEAYLMEGKAPSKELRSLMATFRAWLVSIYKSLTRLNVELTPEVRGVFDRLLATDEQIEAARNEAVVQPIFTSAVEAGMTDTEFAAYQKTVEDASRTAQEELEQKLIQDFTRERKKWWKDERAKVKAEVTAEVDEQRVYKAIAALQSEGGIRLDRKAVANAYGKDFLKRLPRGVAVIEGGAHADTVAELVGYGSGQEMLTDLANARPRNALIEAETDRRMHEEHGDLLTDGGLYDEARKAVQNELHGKVIEAEIRALNKKAREVKPFVQAERKAGQEAASAGRQVYQALVPNLAAVRAQAARIIAAKQVREVRPMAYFAAARKASRAAIDAYRKKDYLMAGHQKGMELLNLELYREANRVKDEIESSIDKLKKAFAPDAKVAKSRNVDMVNAARAILAFHGIGRADKAPMAYLDAMRRYDPEMYENMRDQVESVSEKQIDYREMTVDEFIGMRDSVLALMHTSRRSKQMMVDGKLIDRKEAVEQLAARVAEFGDKKREAGYKRAMTKWEKTQAGLLGARAIMRRVEHWVDAMDGGDPAGVFRRYVWNPVSDAVNRYREEKKNVLQKYLELVKGVETTITHDKIDAPELGYTFNGKIELLHAVLHSGNESNLSKLLRGRGWGELREDGTLDTSKWDRFIDRMIAEKKLTKADYDFAQGVWDMLDALKPAVQKAHHEMYGYYFDEVTATPFENEFGSYRGGYVPAIVDPDIVADAAVRKDKEELLHGQNSFAFPTTGRGATMKRVEQYAKPLQLDMRTIPAHIDWAMRFAYIEPSVKDVGRLLINKDLRASLDNHDPAAARHMLMPWLQRTSNQAVTSPGMLPWLDKIAKEVRKRTGLQVMTANVINALQQLTGPSIALVKVKPHILRNAFWQYITHPKATTEMIAEQSLFMRNRVFTQQADIIQTLDELLLNPTKYEKARAFAEKHGYFLQQGTQGFVDKVVWTGAYNQAVQQDMPNTDAVRYADSVVRETQGSFSAEDISRVEAGTPFLRLFLMFYNYFNMQANLLGTEFANIATNQMGLRKGAGRALYLYIFGFMIPAFIGDGLIRALIAGEPDDDDDGYLDDYIAMFFSTQGRTLSAMVPVAGQIVMAGINMWNKKWYDDRITTSPAVSMIESSVRAPRSVYKAIVDEGSDKRAIQDTLSLIGMVSGYPVVPLARPLGYLADIRQGKASQPENVIDLTRGLVSGRDPNRSK